MKVNSKSTEIKIPRTLNEHVLGRCNLEYPEKAPEVVGAASLEFAKAVKDRRDLEKKTKDDFAEKDKLTKEFVKKTANINLKESRKIREAAEDLSDEAVTLAGNLDAFVSRARKDSKVKEYLDNSEIESIKKAADVLGDFGAHFNESYKVNSSALYESRRVAMKNMLKESVGTALYKRAGELSDEILAFLEDAGREVEEDDASQITYAAYLLEMFSKSLYPVELESLREEDEPTDSKRTYSDREKKSDLLRNQISTDIDDLWLDIYDELDATTSPGFVKDMDRKLSAGKGERYGQVLPDQDDPYKIWVYALTPEDFAFARQVADYYGVKMDEPEPTGPREEYYKLRAGIHVDQPAD